ncbi:GORK, partial [Symbiodinium natans]
EILDAISFHRALSPGQEKNNCCQLACLSLKQIQDAFSGTESEATFDATRKSVVSKFKALTRLGAFPGVPAEVIWMIAEHSEVSVFEKDDIIVKEGSCGPMESMIIIESGAADVEMVMFDRELLEARGCRIAKLLPGAIIGDVCFVESWVSRPASVVAREQVRAFQISSRALLEVMACYPGMASIYMSRTRDTSVVLQRSLTRPQDVLAGMKLFYGMEPGFIRLLANISERKMNFLGDVVKEEGSTDRTLRLQEFGKVRAETEAEGCVSITDVGTVLGEKMFLGWRTRSQATFRVATPIAVMLWIAQHHFEGLLESNPSENAYFRGLEEKETDGGTEAVKHKAEDLQLFRGCGRSFTQDIGSFIGRRAYKPGQAIVVQKAADGGSLFIVTGGRAAVLIYSKVKEEISTGDVFGELALLGLVLRRAATVAAITYCTCLEMPKKAFVKALDRHPEEIEHFEQLTRLHGAAVAKEMGTWPFLTKATERLLYYVNLHASRESTPVGQWTSRDGVEIPTDMAFLVVSGEIYVSENSGRRMLMAEGSCFGEHILIGLPTSTLKIEPKTACELQMMNRQTFERIMAECPDERDTTVQGILNEMAIKAEVKLGVTRGASEILKRSAVFRAASEEFIDDVRPRMYACLYKDREVICDEKEVADHMFIIVRGHAAVLGDSGEEEDSVLRFKAGTACCESAILGTCTYFPYAVKAMSLCLALTLSRKDFEAALDKFPHEKQMFAKLLEDEESQDMLFSLPRVLKINHLLFQSSSIDFLRKMCEFADEVYYAPGETIIIRGESCAVGKTVMYVLLSGVAIVRLSFGDEVAQIQPGMMIGEGGALGITDKRSTEICAHKDTFMRCIRLQGASIRKAIDAHPEDCEALEQTFKKRSQQNAQAEGRRREWLQSQVIPILRHCNLFMGFSMKLISKIAEPLLKTTILEGKDLCTVGESSDSMIMVVDGEVEIKSKDGKVDVSGLRGLSFKDMRKLT